MEYVSIENIVDDERRLEWSIEDHFGDLLSKFNNGSNYKTQAKSTPSEVPKEEESGASSKSDLVKKLQNPDLIGDALEFWKDPNRYSIQNVKVVKVVDGDTFWFSYNGKYYKARMKGIDAPEIAHKDGDIDQCFGQDAYDALVLKLIGKDNVGEVIRYDGTYVKDENQCKYFSIVKPDDGDDIDDIDEYGRCLVYIYETDSITHSINEYMVENGFAYVYHGDFKNKGKYEKIEQKAKNEKRGLWADYKKEGGGGCSGKRMPTGIKKEDLSTDIVQDKGKFLGFTLDQPGFFGDIVPKEIKNKQMVEHKVKETKYYPYFAASLYKNMLLWAFERSVNQLDDYISLPGIDGKIDFQDVRNNLSTYTDMVLPSIGNIHGITPLFYMKMSYPMNTDVLDAILEDIRYQESTIWTVYLSQIDHASLLKDDLIKKGYLKNDGDIADISSIGGIEISRTMVEDVFLCKDEVDEIGRALEITDTSNLEKLDFQRETNKLLWGMGLNNLNKNGANGLMNVFTIYSALKVFGEIKAYASLLEQIYDNDKKADANQSDIYLDLEDISKFIGENPGDVYTMLTGNNQQVKNFIDICVRKIIESHEKTKDKTFYDIFKLRSTLANNIATDLLSLSSIVQAATSSNIEESVKSLLRMWGLESPENIIKRRKMFRQVILHLFDDIPCNINKSFPTFRIYIINPANPFIRSFEDFYDIRAVESIDIYRDKSGISSTAHVTIVDKIGHLLLGSDNYAPEIIGDEFLPNVYKDLTLRQGMKILIYLGYTNTEKHLKRRFWGRITDVVPGENGRIEIVAQGYGAETLTTAGSNEKSGNEEDENKTKGIIDIGSTMMMSNYGDILAYVFKNSSTMPDLGSNVSMLDPHYISGMGYTGFTARGFWKYIIESIASNIFVGGIDAGYLLRYIFGGLGRLMENIYLSFLPSRFFDTPATSAAKRFKDYLSHLFKVDEKSLPSWVRILLPLAPAARLVLPKKDNKEFETMFGLEYRAIGKTVYDVLSEIANFHPGFMAAILPYFDGINYADTIYVGKRDGLYKNSGDFVSRIIDGYIIKEYIDYIRTKSSGDEESKKEFLDTVKKYEENKYGARPENYSIDLYHMLIEDAPDIAVMLNSVVNVKNYHLVTSSENILKNNIIASSTDMHNVVNYYFTNDVRSWSPGLVVPDSNIFKNFISLSLCDTIESGSLLPMDIHSANTDPNWLLSRFYMNWIKTNLKENGVKNSLIASLPSYLIPPINVLSEEASKMYKGELILLGHPNINPHDILYIQDDINDMFGFVEAEAVIDHFSYDTGYVTVVQPALLTYTFSVADEYMLPRIQNIFTMQRYMDVKKGALKALLGLGIGSSVSTIAAFLGLAGGPIGVAAGILVGAVGMIKVLQRNAQVTMLRLGKFMSRNAINLVPLWYRGLPYVAGIEGYRKESVEAMVIDKYKDKPFTRILVAEDPWAMYYDEGSTNLLLNYLIHVGLGSLVHVIRNRSPRGGEEE